jgi:hypothetical protein
LLARTWEATAVSEPAHALQARWLQSAASTAGLENDSADDVVMILMMLCFLFFFRHDGSPQIII